MNSFIDELLMALENQEPSDDFMDEASGVGNPDLPSQRESNDDETGNPPAPGDDEMSPIGHEDDGSDFDFNAEDTELDSQKDSSLANANDVPAPGDDNGNPNPTNAPSALESTGLVGAAYELFGNKGGKEAVNAMRPMEIVNAYMAKEKEENGRKIDTSSDAAAQLKQSIRSYTEHMATYDPKHKFDNLDLSFKTINGIPCIVTMEKGSGNIIDVQWKLIGKSKNHAVTMNTMKSAVAKSIGKSAKATESDDFCDGECNTLFENIELHKNRNLIPLDAEARADAPSGNSGDPANNDRTPVSPSGDTHVIDVDEFVRRSYSESGNAGSPGANGTPVSKSGDSTPLQKNEFEVAADDKDGNPDSPGVKGNPEDATFRSFVAALNELNDDRTVGNILIPQNMSLESYAMELGMGEIAAKAMEAKLSAAERKALKDSDFGLPETRQWPLNDEDHVRSAITNFHWCPKEKQKELAKNILKAMRRFDVKLQSIDEGNPFAKYCPDVPVRPRRKRGSKN